MHALHERVGQDGTSDLLAPTVGVFASKVLEGQIVTARQIVGTMDILGVRWDLVVPDAVSGRVTKRAGGGRSRVPVDYGAVLFSVSKASMGQAAIATTAVRREVSPGLSFVAPMSGRFYSRPSPSESPFLSVGDSVQRGQTIGLLEVMKTFNRLVYQGESLPERATVKAIVPREGADVVRGDVILLLSPSLGS